MKKLTVLISISLFILSCANKTQETKVEKPVSVNTPSSVQATLESVPQYVLDSLYNKTTQIEGSMYNAGGSFTVQGQNAKKIIEFISRKVPTELSKDHVGHLMFLNNGNNLMIINVYNLGTNTYGRFDIDGEIYYSILTGQINDMFTRISITPAKQPN